MLKPTQIRLLLLKYVHCCFCKGPAERPADLKAAWWLCEYSFNDQLASVTQNEEICLEGMPSSTTFAVREDEVQLHEDSSASVGMRACTFGHCHEV